MNKKSRNPVDKWHTCRMIFDTVVLRNIYSTHALTMHYHSLHFHMENPLDLLEYFLDHNKCITNMPTNTTILTTISIMTPSFTSIGSLHIHNPFQSTFHCCLFNEVIIKEGKTWPFSMAIRHAIHSSAITFLNHTCQLVSSNNASIHSAS